MKLQEICVFGFELNLQQNWCDLHTERYFELSKISQKVCIFEKHQFFLVCRLLKLNEHAKVLLTTTVFFLEVKSKNVNITASLKHYTPEIRIQTYIGQSAIVHTGRNTCTADFNDVLFVAT